MLKGLPHGQWEGKLAGCHPYLIQRASLNACLERENPNSDRGMAVSQAEAPLSLDCSMEIYCDLVSFALMLSAKSSVDFRFLRWISFLACS